MSAEWGTEEEVDEIAVESAVQAPSEARQSQAGRAGAATAPRRKRSYDVNEAHLTGIIQRVWEDRGDVVVRLELPHILVKHDARQGGQEEPAPFTIPLRFPQGRTHRGQLISLMDGLPLEASGKLVSTSYAQSVASFLYNANRSAFLEDIPPDDRSAWNKLRFRHTGAEILVEEARVLSALTPRDKRPPRADVSGFINDIDTLRRVGTRLRLLVYDTATKVVEPGHDGGFDHRKPHFVFVLLPNGDFDPLVAQLRRKDHIRVSGELVQRFYAQTLREALMDAQAIQLIERLPDHDAPGDIAIELAEHMVVPEALIRLNS